MQEKILNKSIIAGFIGAHLTSIAIGVEGLSRIIIMLVGISIPIFIFYFAIKDKNEFVQTMYPHMGKSIYHMLILAFLVTTYISSQLYLTYDEYRVFARSINTSLGIDNYMCTDVHDMDTSSSLGCDFVNFNQLFSIILSLIAGVYAALNIERFSKSILSYFYSKYSFLVASLKLSSQVFIITILFCVLRVVDVDAAYTRQSYEFAVGVNVLMSLIYFAYFATILITVYKIKIMLWGEK